MKVKIVKCSDVDYWYENKIEEVFEVEELEEGKYCLVNYNHYLIDKCDCIILDKSHDYLCKKIDELAARLDDIEKSERPVCENSEAKFELPECYKSYDDYFCSIDGEGMPEPLESQVFSKKTYATLKLQWIADQLNGDWIPDWSNSNQDKYFIYSTSKKELKIFHNSDLGDIGRIYFKSKKLAKQAIEIMGNDLEYLIGV
jgi:hypothetical protein